MSELLKLKANVDEAELITRYADKKKSKDIVLWNAPSYIDGNLMKIADTECRNSLDPNDIITSNTVDLSKENSILKNVYEDYIRGYVILNKLNDNPKRVNTYRPENGVASVNDIVNEEQQHSFIYTAGVESIITNPFKGLELNGATISMWIRVPNFSSLNRRSAILTFLGDLTHYDHPTQPDGIANDVLTTPYLTIEANSNIYFNEAYYNNYCKYLEGADCVSEATIEPYRKGLGRRWEHFIFTFTNEGIETYINGVKVEYTTEYKGKRFNTGELSSLMQFLTNEKTNLFLGLTILGDSLCSQCDMIMYDNIRFFDECLSEEKAKELFEEEIELYNQSFS